MEKTYLILTTNVLRNYNLDGTLTFHNRYILPLSSVLTRKPPVRFDNEHPAFTYHRTIKLRPYQTLSPELSRANIGNDEIVLAVGEDELIVTYHNKNSHAWEQETFDDLAFDSDFTDEQQKYIHTKVTDFYKAFTNDPKANIAKLQEEYLTWYPTA